MSSRNNQQRFNLGIGFELMPQTLDGQFRKDFPPYVDGLVRSLPGNYVTTPRFAKKADEIYNFKPRDDDVYVLTFPKSGTTWMQELVWMVMNDCDFEKGRENMLFIRSPFLEMDYLLPPKIADKCNAEVIARKTNLPFLSKIMELLSSWNLMSLLQPVVKSVRKLLLGDVMRDLEEITRMESPRVIKSHLPFYLLNPTLLDTSKVVYVARNPKDVIVSYYYYHRILAFHQYTGDFDAFVEYFMKDEVYAAPYFPHVIDAWNKRHHPNMHFVFYEDLKKDLKGEIVRIASFLGKQLTDEQLTKLTQHLSFDKFSKNESVNMEICKDVGCMSNNGKFIRKGKTGDWKNHFSPELNQRVDTWIKANLSHTDLSFITELDKQD